MHSIYCNYLPAHKIAYNIGMTNDHCVGIVLLRRIWTMEILLKCRIYSCRICSNRLNWKTKSELILVQHEIVCGTHSTVNGPILSWHRFYGIALIQCFILALGYRRRQKIAYNLAGLLCT